MTVSQHRADCQEAISSTSELHTKKMCTQGKHYVRCETESMTR